MRSFASVDDLVAGTSPSFVVVSVPRDVAPGAIRHLAGLKVPVLTETPPAPDVEALASLYPLVGRGAIIQVGEQYADQLYARFDCGDRLGVYDFAEQLYFSWIRANRLLIRGHRGEINDAELHYLDDAGEPVATTSRRVAAGEGGNLEGFFLRGMMAGSEWVFRNGFIPARLSHDELAIAECLQRMSDPVQGGPDLYSLADASQDHYLSLLMREAALTGRTVRSRRQVWSR